MAQPSAGAGLNTDGCQRRQPRPGAARPPVPAAGTARKPPPLPPGDGRPGRATLGACPCGGGRALGRALKRWTAAPRGTRLQRVARAEQLAADMPCSPSLAGPGVAGRGGDGLGRSPTARRALPAANCVARHAMVGVLGFAVPPRDSRRAVSPRAVMLASVQACQRVRCREA